jgi:hypothetical protein
VQHRDLDVERFESGKQTEHHVAVPRLSSAWSCEIGVGNDQPLALLEVDGALGHPVLVAAPNGGDSG